MKTWRAGLSLLFGVFAGRFATMGDEAVPLHLFRVPAPVLRRAVTNLPAAPVVETIALQTRAGSVDLELAIQRHQSMNGAPLLRAPTPVAASGFQRTLDRLLPPKGAFFSKNPNARRDPLIVDGW